MTAAAPARLLSLLTLLGVLLAACQPVLADAPTQAPPTSAPSSSPTETAKPTEVPLPVGSEPTLVPTGEPIAEPEVTEVLVAQTVALQPVTAIPELATIEFDVSPITRTVDGLSNLELLATTNGGQGDSMRYTVVMRGIKDGSPVLILPTSLTVDGNELAAGYPSYFDQLSNGRLVARTEGVTYAAVPVHPEEPLGIFWNQELPTLVRGELRVYAGEPIYGLRWVNGDWQQSSKAEGKEWTGETWEKLIPALPEWAGEYIDFHRGVQEQIGDKWYYTVDRTVEVNGETRVVQVKLLELDKKWEWIPCYETIEELLTNQQLMTLMKLNQISAPEEALWLVRTGETIVKEREDLVKLEQIMARFMKANDHLFEGDGWGAVMADGDTWLGMNQGYMEVGRLDKFNHIPAQPDYVVDGVDLTYPHAYFVLRRGNEDQVLFGGIPLRFQHTSAWFGYDQSALEWWRNKYGNQNGGKYLDKYLTELTVAVSKNQNLENDNRIQNFFFTPTSSNEVDAELSGYFSLRGVDREYCEDLFRAAGGYFIEFEPHFSNGNIFWAHMIFKDNK